MPKAHKKDKELPKERKQKKKPEIKSYKFEKEKKDPYRFVSLFLLILFVFLSYLFWIKQQ